MTKKQKGALPPRSQKKKSQPLRAGQLNKGGGQKPPHWQGEIKKGSLVETGEDQQGLHTPPSARSPRKGRLKGRKGGRDERG